MANRREQLLAEESKMSRFCRTAKTAKVRDQLIRRGNAGAAATDDEAVLRREGNSQIGELARGLL